MACKADAVASERFWYVVVIDTYFEFAIAYAFRVHTTAAAYYCCSQQQHRPPASYLHLLELYLLYDENSHCIITDGAAFCRAAVAGMGAMVTAVLWER